MMNQFEVYALCFQQQEVMIGNGDPLGGATLTFPTLNPTVIVACILNKFDHDFTTMVTGKSSTSLVEKCEFRAAWFGAAQLPLITKGLECELVVGPGLASLPMQLMSGGLFMGGLMFQFMLASRNYKA